MCARVRGWRDAWGMWTFVCAGMMLFVYIVVAHTCSHHHHTVQVAICMPIRLCAELVNALVAFLQVEHNQCKLQEVMTLHVQLQ